MSSTPRLRVHGLRSALAGPFDLHVDAGECVVLMGKSGAGKTVLLRLIADLDPPRAGVVELDGAPRERLSGPGWRRRVIYQPAEPAWWSPVVSQHFEGAHTDKVRSMVAALGLPGAILDAELMHLSTGERQRLALVRSLSRSPSVLLLDEPTASLDQTSTLAYETLLGEETAKGTAVLWVTHSEEQAGRVGHRCLTVADRALQSA
ncbi:ATP-binding cassette domain-containing protein [Variovorax sp. YR216]|uniref:ABC transporter ATP-binding protein n=1 Tax=Variovorax sp. YR216 TaxID=1882828 RepID=UPI0008954030|nr:ATP-binding cassette domain-containing protein [Variovorax sp. YR216]SEB21865.1 ABC-type iron transport system FetAB, ATPase component [Variovorax sp. YR216]